MFKQILEDLEVALVTCIMDWSEVFILSLVNYSLTVIVSNLFNQMLYSFKVIHQNCYVKWEHAFFIWFLRNCTFSLCDEF